MAIAQDRYFISDAGQCSFDVLVSIGSQGFFQVIRHPVVVHHNAAALAMAGPVHPSNGLQQFGFLDRSVQVHHAFDGGIEARQ
ncbi:hypothetical protein D3C75_1318510 [compost metagenome]